jgi:uncharacterized protein (TIGR02147 family)
MDPVFNYLDYRTLLREYFSELKKQNPKFSFRSFNRRAGVQSSGFLKLVMDGKRNLGGEGIRSIVKGFKLKEEEARYFELLVKFNQSNNHEDRDYYFNELCKNKKFLSAKPLTVAQCQLFSHWYYVAILELARIRTKDLKDIDWISQRIHPAVEKRKIKKALQELVQLNLLKVNEKGSYQRNHNMVTTEDEVRSLAVTKFHQQMSEMAAQAVVKAAAKEREFSSLTILTSETGFQQAKEEIQKFRRRLHSILEQNPGGGRTTVAHINLQLFKLSKDVL